ncbi:hypothetical protein [Pseudarthrobacter scleromae]|uniref:hypothetical protein n=1 Tax=Pseudarthrobacter scleromae TaxID=158897 RepID=UPI003CFE28D9
MGNMSCGRLRRHAEALKAAHGESVRINQLMADAAKPEERTQSDPSAHFGPRMDMNASFPPQPRAATSSAIATTG